VRESDFAEQFGSQLLIYHQSGRDAGIIVLSAESEWIVQALQAERLRDLRNSSGREG
jgi:hypothetical protein